MSSKPTTATSAGTARPASASARSSAERHLVVRDEDRGHVGALRKGDPLAMTGCRGPVAADERRCDQPGALERAAPAALAFGGGIRVLGSGEVPHRRMAECDEVLGGRAGAPDSWSDCTTPNSLVRRRVDDDELETGRGLRAPAAARRLVQHDRAVDALVAEVVERVGEGCRVGCGHDGECVAAEGRGIRHRLQHARVAHRGEVETTSPIVCVRPVRSALAARCGR